MPGGRAHAWLAAIILTTAACGGGPTTLNQQRENAFRANNRGVALLEQFSYDAAIDAFRQALQIDPTLKIAQINLPIALFYGGRIQEASVAAAAARDRYADAPQPLYVLGLVARAGNQPDAAVDAFQRVLKLDPGDVGSMVNLALMYVQQRRYAETEMLCRAALAIEPYNATAAYNLGLALTRAGDSAGGQRALQRFQELRAAPYAITYSQTYLEEGRYAAAVATTGAEADLVEAAAGPAKFTPVQIAAAASAAVGPSPFGRSFTAAELTPDNLRTLAVSLGGGLTLIDADRDGDLDVFVVSAAGQRLYRNDGRGTFVDVTASSGLGSVPADSVPIGAVAGDYDNDGVSDLFVLRYGSSSLYHNDGAGHFTDVTVRAGLPAYSYLPATAAFVDVDHDGDLDLVVAGLADLSATRAAAAGRTLIFPHDFAPAPLQLLRNNGDGTFTDITASARLQVRSHALAIVPTDFDNRRDIDLLVVNRDAPPMLFKNLRDGTFQDVAADVGLAAVAGATDEVTAVAAADVNKDDFPDFFFARGSGGVFALSDSRGRFSIVPAPAPTRSATASQLVDYDNDGLIDLVTWSMDGPHVFRNLGSQWSDVTTRAVGSGSTGSPGVPASARGVAAGDLNGDGATDLVSGGSPSLLLWLNGGDPRHRSLGVQLKGRVSNRLGAGSKIQLRAGSLSERLETSAATPAVAPADIVLGLGLRPSADVVRVLWPSGILQAEISSPTAAFSSPLSIEELDRKPSSCPFLFAWNGERFEFITDFMGGGEMGYWEGPGQPNRPHPLEYVRIRGDQLHPKDGRFEIRVTNELEETLFADRLQLLGVAHPTDVDVFPNEGMTEPPKPFHLFAVRDARVPPRALDDHGHDVTSRLARIDRQYPDDFRLSSFRGYAADHTITLDLGMRSGPTVLLMTAWTDYAFSSDNLAAHQAGLSLTSPSLEIKTAAGGWRTAIADIGIPIGRPQTMVVDLSPYLHPGDHEVRIVTNMRIYWDQILVATSVPSSALRMVPFDAIVANLHQRGFSAEVRPDGKEPAGYDYRRVSLTSPWKVMPGQYTREGDVRQLLAHADDMFVIAKPGDEIALAFDAREAAPLPSGWTRTFLLLADGFSKEMDINSASPERVEPLPFHRMTRYPYAAPEHYPDAPAYQDYRARYNTRTVVKSVPSIDGAR